MQVKEVMSTNPQYLLSTSTIRDAARKMRELDTGFLPIGDKESDKIVGTLTDRDIVITAIAENKTLDTPVKSVMHEGVCYCYETDDIKEASKSMKDKQIRRLIVLNQDKKLTGVVSLGDIALHCGEDELPGETLEEISRH
ncbi:MULTISPECIES: CBS domain-containing protein [unclassified Legionella]|uniref:CBS domain-containing protein n=1 Tax=unclassified Legionella TaxID=2622702 RepID=UPI001055AC4A|nr:MULTISPECIES: CBS domain-containing protein [unclassified Legionella]MDI9819512.1 CBS domain-containing protein [Legionella sp. PL877]